MNIIKFNFLQLTIEHYIIQIISKFLTFATKIIYLKKILYH